MTYRKRLIPVLLVGALALALAGCSRGGSSVYDDISGRADAASRGAEGEALLVSTAPGWNTDAFNPDTHCEDGYKIQLCFIFVNRTTAFSKPFVASSRLPLTVTKFCSGNGDPAELGGYSGCSGWGKLACYNRTGANCEGRLTPNPFTDEAGMLFVNNGATSGAEPTVHLQGTEAPFKGSGAPAQAYFSSPYNGSNDGHGVDGTYLAITLDRGSFTSSSWKTLPRFTITDRPVRIRVQNSAKNVQLKLDQPPKANNFLVDEAAASKNSLQIGPYSSGFFGGYRAVAGNSSLVLQFVIADGAGSTVPTPTCPGCGQPVTATFSFEPGVKTGRPTAGSKCEVTTTSPIARYTCADSRVDGDDSMLTFTVNFREEGQ